MSENADLAERFALEGIAFIGPPASAIVSMGSNSVSKNIMSAAGVLVVSGHHGNQDLDFLQQEALRIDYPVLIKPVPRSNTLITELDVIQRQLEVAAGDALLLDQSSIPLVGRAFESRLYAENPRNFLLDSGQLAYLSTPTPTHIFTAPPGAYLWENVRWKSTEVENIKFSRALGGNQAFIDGDVETGFIPLFPPTPEPPDEALAQAMSSCATSQFLLPPTLRRHSLLVLQRDVYKNHHPPTQIPLPPSPSLALTVAASLPDSFSPTFAAVSAVLESPLTFAGARARTTMVPPPARRLALARVPLVHASTT
ncbi:uncharacterized protein BXZ73DRAFT_107043 [Epithele typhae]|uniref:uncharacterized protein n=1 Tax=Epithele typhae TaxID=378194 RepID=UPI002008113A|nr:uncharacterized protein BXZ73DRAFT_107043 [Epithele typhae]KAH9913067.1 hypothetical protein BXZ73DRAFT_107043 [Epithele typhae]